MLNELIDSETAGETILLLRGFRKKDLSESLIPGLTQTLGPDFMKDYSWLGTKLIITFSRKKKCRIL